MPPRWGCRSSEAGRRLFFLPSKFKWRLASIGAIEMAGMRFDIAGLFLILLLALASPASAQSKDRVVAVVNGEVITLKQLDKRVDTILKTPQARGMSRDTARSKVLDALIDQELINQAAKAKGVFVTDSDISMALESIKKVNNLTDAHLRAYLAHGGTDQAAFREDVRVALVRHQIVWAPG